MSKNQNGYNKSESAFGQFTRSGVGRFIILVVVLGIVGVIAYMTCPTKQQMEAEIRDDVRQWLFERDSINSDWLDDAVSNVGYAFTEADSTVSDTTLVRLFDTFNTLEYNNHVVFATMTATSTRFPEGKRCGYGLFGLVFTTVNFNDFIPHDGPLRKEYNQPVPDTYGTEEYFGENPDLGGVFRYNGE